MSGQIAVIDEGPTAEQRRRFTFEEAPLQEGTVLKGRAYRRVPHFRTLVASGVLGEELGQVLGWYRDRWDIAQYSPLRDSLGKHQPHGGGGNVEAWRARILDAQDDVDYAERGVHPWLRITIRAMVLLDMSAADLARERHGCEKPHSRQVTRIMNELRTGACQMLAQVKHIVDAEEAKRRAR